MNTNFSRTKKLALCSLARDCASLMEKNIPRLEALASHFAEVEFFVVENDSKDHTRSALKHWQVESKYKIHLPDLHAYYTQINEEINFNIELLDIEYWDRYKERVKRIALARDCYLDALGKSSFAPDYVLMLDIDVYNFSKKGLLTSLEKEEWDVLTANGFMYTFTQGRLERLYYDSFAVELLGEESLPRNTKTFLQTQITEDLKSNEYLAVGSAFGGMGIYKYDAIYKNGLTLYLNAVLEDEGNFCEHISFHRQLAKKGHGKIFISAQMLVHYNTKARGYAKKLRELFKSIKGIFVHKKNSA